MAASALSLLAPPLTYLGRVEEAYAAGRQGVSEAERAGRPVILAAARTVSLVIDVYAGVPPTLGDLAVLRARVEGADGVAVRAYALSGYGMAAMLLGRPEAAAVLEQASTAADAIGGLHMSCLARSYLALAQASGEPRSALRALRVAVVEYHAARIPFGPRVLAAELLHFFAEIPRWTTIAVLDGATPPVSLFPEAARAAKRAARQALGDSTFEECAARGRTMLHEEFEAFIHSELDDLGVEQHTATLP
jgi:hypothetical protein